MAYAWEAAVRPVRSRWSPLRAVFAACGLTLGWVTTDVVYSLLVDQSRLRLLTTYLLPVFAAAVLFALWRLGLEGTSRARPAALLAGGSFLVAAACCDLFVTIRSDPFLNLEGNPYIRALLDTSSHPYWLVYALVVLTQALFVSTFVAAWWAFLRHQGVIAESVRAAAPRSWPQFLKAATGGGGLTYRQWLFPLRPREIPNPYHSVWPAALAVSFGVSLLRFWLAGEWLHLVPARAWLRGAVLMVGVGGTMVAYFAWLAWAWRRSRAES
jgi:hypothetical protein